MNKNRDYYRAVLFGAAVATFFLSMFYVFTREDEPQKPQSNFEVVDTYKGCDVVRWTQDNLATYHYFLDCRK
jgi:hypothetical protein